MRWVIVGPYPPEQGDGAARTVGEVAALLDAGDQVVVVSPRPSAAHVHKELVGWAPLWSLARMVGPADGFWARVEPGVLLTRTPGRLTSVVERLVLGLVLRRAAQSTLDVGDASMFPGGRAGSVVFRSVDRLVVHSAADQELLLASGAPRTKVALHDSLTSAPEPPTQGASPESTPLSPPPPPTGLVALAAGDDRDQIEAALRARAAEAPVRSAPRS